MKSHHFLATSIIFALGAIYLAAKGSEGWGWFIVGSILTYPGNKHDEEDDES